MPPVARRKHTRRPPTLCVLAALCCTSTLVACGGETASGGQEPPDHVSVVATVKRDSIPVFSKPGGKPQLHLSNPTRGGADRVFLVRGGNDEGWLQVLLPVRPNGSVGWIRADDVELDKTTYRVHIALSTHRFVAMRGKDDVVASGPIALGKDNTPTPDGDYYIVSLLKTPKKSSAYGPYAFGLSGFSGVLETFRNGPARIGLHGTNKPQLLGQDVSHGCIRMSNDNITKLANTLPLGTPVYVHA